MTPGSVIQALTVIEGQLAEHLEDSTTYVLSQARSEVTRTFKDFQRGQRLNPPVVYPWGFSISPRSPLKFRAVPIDGHDLRFDIYGEHWWTAASGEMDTHLVVVRVWAMDLNDMFRDAWDAESLFSQLQGDQGRVIMRFHFDRANSEQLGPEYHLQIGGQSQAEELCWLHHDLSIPRFYAFPMDLTLACEFVVANTHGMEDAALREPLFTGVVSESQRVMLTRQLEIVSQALLRERSVLRSVWNQR